MASPVALVPLEALQFGVETTSGTLVAADTIHLAEDGGAWQPEIDREEINETRGVLGMVEDVITRKGSLLTVQGALDFEHLILALVTGLKSTTPSGAGPYTWTVQPSLTNPDARKSATWEVAYRDGSNKRVEREFGYSMCRKFTLSGQFNQPAKFSAEYFGKADQSSTFTGSLSALTREVIRTNQLNFYVDDSWAALGTNHVTNLVRSFSLEVTTGVEPFPAADSLTDLDYDTVLYGEPSGLLTLTCAVQADVTAELAKWRSGDLRFWRMYAAGSSSRELTVDMAGRYMAAPTFGRDGNIRTATFQLAFRYDPTSAAMLAFEVINGLADI